MTWIAVVLIAVIGLFLSGFFSGAETGLYRVNRVRLRLGVQKRDPTALRLAGVLDDEPRALSVTLVGTNLANYMTTSAVAYLFAECVHYGETQAQLLTVAVVTPVIFVFGEVVPKSLFQLHADTLLARGSRLLALSDRVLRLTGIVWALKRLASALGRLAGNDAYHIGAFGPKRRVAALLQEALAGNVMGEDQSDLINRVCKISETPLHTVMVPRNRVTVAATATSRKGLLRIERKTGHSQLPVFESNRRRIVGTVKVDELFQDEEWETLGERTQRAVTLRPHETVATAITCLQRARASMAIITDRGGQMIGIVTLKDLLGEVLGELATFA